MTRWALLALLRLYKSRPIRLRTMIYILSFSWSFSSPHFSRFNDDLYATVDVFTQVFLFLRRSCTIMSTVVPRWIIVDDVDPQIQYTGPWFPDHGSQDSVGNFGPPYQSTMHGTNSNASLSFAFHGEHHFPKSIKLLIPLVFIVRNPDQSNWLQ